MAGTQGRALQFIQVDAAGHCHVQEEAAAVLSSIQTPVAIVGIAGLARTGKSYLLNRVLGVDSGFDIGPTVNPCTKGLWVWNQPVRVKSDLHCVFLDTEGLGSTQRTASCDMQIFSLCVLLSSYFIYNSMGAIDEQAIEDLNLVVHLAEHIHVQRNRSVGRREDLAKHFPALLWVVRDFFLRLVDERGIAINERDYLEDCLRSQAGQEEKNKVRGAIKDLFVDRDCMALPRPVADEGDLRHLERLPYESLRPKFRQQVENFIRKVYGRMKPKEIGGSAVTGSVLVALAEEYCAAINAGAVPSIQSAWAAATQMLLRDLKKKALESYKQHFSQKLAAAGRPLEDRELQGLHDSAAAHAFNVLMEPGLDTRDETVALARQELDMAFTRFYEEARQDNAASSRVLCEQLAADLYHERIAPRLLLSPQEGGYGHVQELMEDWSRLKEAYSQSAVGPGAAEVSTTWIFQTMSQSVQQLWGELQNANSQRLQQHLGSMQAKLQDAQAHSDHISSTLAMERSRQQQELEEARQSWVKEKSELASQLQAAKSQMSMSSPALPPPSVPAHVASAMATHLWRRARTVACRASMPGLPCRVIDRESGNTVPSILRLDASAEAISVQDLLSDRAWRCGLLQLKNAWLCADSELACLAWKSLKRGAADAACVVLIDGAPGPLGLVMQSSQAREELLDTFAVLIAVQRSRKEPELVRRCSPGGLRPPGLSLQAVHISGPICGWLAEAGQGEELLVPKESQAEARRALMEAAEALKMAGQWQAGGY